MYAVFNEQSPNQNGAMKNVKVRQALEYAINKAAIAQALGGTKIAQPVSQILGPIDVGYQPFNLYPTAGNAGDPQKVKQLLAAAGYPNGITVKLLYPTTSYNPQVAELMQSDLQAAGVKVQMISATQTDFTINYISSPQSGQRGVWDIALLFWVPDWFGINGRSVLEPMTDGTNYGPNSVDYGDYNSPVTDNLVQQALTQPSTDTAQISDLWHQASEQTHEGRGVHPARQRRRPALQVLAGDEPGVPADQRELRHHERVAEQRMMRGSPSSGPDRAGRPLMALLEVDDLHVSFSTQDGVVRAVRGVSFTVEAGQTLGIVGESGSGKSVSTQTIVGLTRGARVSGSARFEGRELLPASDAELRRIRGAQIGDDLPGPAVEPASAIPGRVADRGDDPGA